MSRDVDDSGVPHFGVLRFRSAFDVDKTIDGLEQAFAEHGITVFARIDFSADAQRAGLSMRPERLLVVGNPQAGMALMQAEPAVGLDLPLKVLVWEDEQGDAWIACNTPEYIVGRHELPHGMADRLTPPMAILERFARR